MSSNNSEQSITITKLQFITKMSEVSNELSKLHPAMSVITALVLAKATEKLFDQDSLQIVKENES